VKRRRARRSLPLVPLLAAFCIGVLADWALHRYGPPKPASDVPTEARVVAAPKGTSGVTPTPREPRPVTPERADAAVGMVATTSTSGPLRVPIDDAKIESFKGGFSEKRGHRAHEAVDILAPRNTPVHAVDSGTIARFFVSKQGGNTIYQFDPTGRLCYYYAHLERFASGLREGDAVSQGQVIGYVGTTGNAPPNTPHLHFAVFELGEDRRWWKGKALDPYLVFRGRSTELHSQ
jgi:murein DD-endopeptidase MepM/ murein hydrolase activator NlpD